MLHTHTINQRDNTGISAMCVCYFGNDPPVSECSEANISPAQLPAHMSD